ncbi:MAG: rRNA maturation RNase YbeY [Myxococcales bacterium]|nr:rRNA maturation RNase YbeY [Myxococcales bacterium]
MATVVQRQGPVRAGISLENIARCADRMLACLDLGKQELSVVLCDDRTIHELNRRYRRKNRPTDVLAFAMSEGTPMMAGDGMLGDVVISVETAKRQAAERGHALRDELIHLLAHGILHLAGYDHRTDAEERRMNARADVLRGAAIAVLRGKSARRAPARGSKRRRAPVGGRRSGPVDKVVSRGVRRGRGPRR